MIAEPIEIEEDKVHTSDSESRSISDDKEEVLSKNKLF